MDNASSHEAARARLTTKVIMLDENDPEETEGIYPVAGSAFSHREMFKLGRQRGKTEACRACLKYQLETKEQ